jgi:16S rRNA (cytosine967-C5)-methyltransferase
LRRRAARAGVFNYRAAPWDGGARLPTKTSFDGVLLDAPCSGLGTWGRNPHARWTTTPSDARELAATQRGMLAAIAPSVKPGGRLVYAVCTITRAETEETAAAFERNFPDFERLALPNPLQPGVPPAPGLWLWPHATGGNAMFVAAWRRMNKG